MRRHDFINGLHKLVEARGLCPAAQVVVKAAVVHGVGTAVYPTRVDGSR